MFSPEVSQCQFEPRRIQSQNNISQSTQSGSCKGRDVTPKKSSKAENISLFSSFVNFIKGPVKEKQASTILTRRSLSSNSIKVSKDNELSKKIIPKPIKDAGLDLLFIADERIQKLEKPEFLEAQSRHDLEGAKTDEKSVKTEVLDQNSESNDDSNQVVEKEEAESVNVLEEAKADEKSAEPKALVQNLKSESDSNHTVEKEGDTVGETVNKKTKDPSILFECKNWDDLSKSSESIDFEFKDVEIPKVNQGSKEALTEKEQENIFKLERQEKLVKLTLGELKDSEKNFYEQIENAEGSLNKLFEMKVFSRRQKLAISVLIGECKKQSKKISESQMSKDINLSLVLDYKAENLIPYMKALESVVLKQKNVLSISNKKIKSFEDEGVDETRIQEMKMEQSKFSLSISASFQRVMRVSMLLDAIAKQCTDEKQKEVVLNYSKLATACAMIVNRPR